MSRFTVLLTFALWSSLFQLTSAAAAEEKERPKLDLPSCKQVRHKTFDL
jgi:hypothetical protein